ncbi:hypothetical protein [Coprothermobacter platensis]|uniref:hypothetical protein n=1 Tax=Coprothermobacter platensis TaxID=108819 RepID=UPI000377AFC1|nr:hypothetical protein [Coprothermobacter platensis]
MNTNRFLRNGWKVTLVTVTILVLMLTCMFTLSIRKPTVAKAEVSQEQLKELLNKALLNYLKATSTYMNISEQTVALTEFNPDSQPIEAVFDVSQTYTLDHKTADEAPLVAGKVKWLEDNRTNLTPDEISVAEVLINEIREQIQEGMVEPFTGGSTWKVTADSVEDAVSGNFKIYLWTVIEHTPAGDVNNWKVTDFLSLAPTEQDVYNGFGETVKAATHAHQTFIENMKKEQQTSLENTIIP